jgi:LacI family transcriptional regulator
MRTASRVLNDHPNVADETRRRVQETIRKLKYTPDSMARSLRVGTDATIGLVVESIADPFFSELIAAVELAASATAKSVLVGSTHRDATREQHIVSQMVQRRVSGLLLAPTASDHSWLSPVAPLVLVDRPAPGISADLVGIDDRDAVMRATDHIIAHGHRRIAYVGDDPQTSTSRARLEGFQDAMAKAGVEVSPRLIRANCPDAQAAGEATHQLMEHESPTAIVSAATRCSFGVVSALHAIGRADVAMIGLGDFAMAATLKPGVSVMDHSGEAVGLRAAARLATRMSQPDLPVEAIDVEVGLIERGSGERRHEST